ncbi:hypothetical protein D3C86_1583880 [compost metagenome]
MSTVFTGSDFVAESWATSASRRTTSLGRLAGPSTMLHSLRFSNAGPVKPSSAQVGMPGSSRSERSPEITRIGRNAPRWMPAAMPAIEPAPMSMLPAIRSNTIGPVPL